MAKADVEKDRQRLVDELDDTRKQLFEAIAALRKAQQALARLTKGKGGKGRVDGQNYSSVMEA